MKITPKRYWRRWSGYQKLDGSSGPSKGKRVKTDPSQKKRGWRIKITPKLRILKTASPKKLLVWIRDSYVKMMMRLANSRVVGYSGSGFGSGQMKEYDEKMLVEIYKSILMARQRNIVHGEDTTSKVPSEPNVVSISHIVR